MGILRSMWPLCLEQRRWLHCWSKRVLLHGEGLRIKAAPTATGDNPPATGDNPLQPQEVNNFWGDLFLYAAPTGDIETVERRARSWMQTFEAKDRDGRTALLYAAYFGQTEIVKLLLDRDADIEAKDSDGMTTLMLASLGGHTEIVKTAA